RSRGSPRSMRGRGPFRRNQKPSRCCACRVEPVETAIRAPPVSGNCAGPHLPPRPFHAGTPTEAWTNLMRDQSGLEIAGLDFEPRETRRHGEGESPQDFCNIIAEETQN